MRKTKLRSVIFADNRNIFVSHQLPYFGDASRIDQEDVDGKRLIWLEHNRFVEYRHNVRFLRRRMP